MKSGFVVNDLGTEQAAYTTTNLALAAQRRGHQVWHISLGDFSYEVDGSITAVATRAPGQFYDSADAFLAELQSERALREVIRVDRLDALLLRNDPAEDLLSRPWARLAGINMGRLAEQRGVTVVNAPDGLYHAVNKLYLQLFPEDIRPRTLITRDRNRIAQFVEEEGGRAIVKPLAGSGGHNVFVVDTTDGYNFNQIISTVSVEGYVIVQQMVPDAAEGDTRLFMLEGNLLEVDGKTAAIRRVPAAGDIRSNMTAGGTRQPAEITEAMRDIVTKVGPILARDGMFLAGLDVIGDKVLEINVFSPGGLFGASQLAAVDFHSAVVEALEAKVSSRR